MVNNVITVVAVIFGIFLGVDMIKNPQSWRNLVLRLRDAYWDLYFWPKRLGWAYAYIPRHSRSKPIPNFMRHWHLIRTDVAL